jgi:hypothetical protein
VTAREYMEKLHSMFEEADDADAQGAFMQAILPRAADLPDDDINF